MKAEKVVFDTNVLVSSILSPYGKPARSVRWVIDNGILVASAPLLEEFASRIRRPKFSKYTTPERVAEFIATLHDGAVQVGLVGDLHVCRDADDDKVLETALRGRASWIVTGDSDLLILHPFRGIQIVLPHVFLAAVASPTP